MGAGVGVEVCVRDRVEGVVDPTSRVPPAPLLPKGGAKSAYAL